MKRKFTKLLGVGLAVMLLASLLLVAVPVSAVIGKPSVTLSANTISSPGNYKIVFDSYFPLAVNDEISVRFPSGTTAPSFVTGQVDITTTGTTGGTAAATPVNGGWNTATRVWTGSLSAFPTLAASKVTVQFKAGADIINPGTPGTYTLEVKTSVETTWVESGTYTVSVPGMIMRYNKDGNFVGTYSTIQEALDFSNEKDVIKIGTGTYTTPITISDPIEDYITIEATGEAADTIIKAAVTINKNYFTFDGVTLKGQVIVTGTDATIRDCILTKQISGTETLLDSIGTRLEVTDCTIDTTYKSAPDTAIDIGGGNDSTISGCTFNTDDGDASTKDTAIDVTATVDGLTVKNCTFNGTKGVGYNDATTDITAATVKDCTFDGFEEAFSISNTAASTLTIRGNTITNQTGSKVGAIDIDATTANANVIIVGNTIEDSTGYSVHIASGVLVDNVTLIGNNFVDNAKGFKNVVTTNISAINNWWGDDSGPSGEGTGDGDAVSTYVTYKPYLTAPVSAGTTKTATSLDAKSVCGVRVSGLTNPVPIWVSKYTANPKDVEPKYDALAGAWFDVYVDGGAGTATLKFYSDDVTKDTAAYVWSGLESKWVKCSEQGASSSGGYVWVTVAESETTPVLGDLSELPFVLLAAKAAAPETFLLTAPEAGSKMPLTNVPFTWASVTDAEDYFLRVSTSAALAKPFVAEVCAGTAYTLTDTLTDGTPYYWQVTARDADGDTIAESDVSTFIATVPVEAVVPEVTVEVEAPAAPEITVDVAAPPAPDVTVEAPTDVAPPTPGYIWVIIAVGAVLVISLIVLIVRTRRVV